MWRHHSTSTDPTQIVSYFQDDEEKLASFIMKTMLLTSDRVHSNVYSMKFMMPDVAVIMGMDEAGNYSNTVDFLAFCNTNISAGITRDRGDDDVTTVATAASTMAETTVSNGTIQGTTTHPDFKTSRPHALTFQQFFVQEINLVTIKFLILRKHKYFG